MVSQKSQKSNIKASVLCVCSLGYMGAQKSAGKPQTGVQLKSDARREPYPERRLIIKYHWFGQVKTKNDKPVFR